MYARSLHGTWYVFHRLVVLHYVAIMTISLVFLWWHYLCSVKLVYVCRKEKLEMRNVNERMCMPACVHVVMELNAT